MSTRSRSGKEALTYHDAVTGRRVLQLTNATCRSVHGYYDLPPWSRQTGQIAFSSLEEGATEGSVYVMERDGADITYLAHSRAMSANDGAMAQWSADGRRVYYKDREDGISLIAWVDVETGEADALPGDLRMICPTGNYNVYHTNSAYLPDHALLRDRERQGAFVMDLDSGESRLIVSVAECLEGHPRRDEIKDWHLYIKHTKWSPDGKRLMFVFTNEIRYAGKFGEEPRVKDICVVDVDGGNLHNVGDFGHHPLAPVGAGDPGQLQVPGPPEPQPGADRRRHGRPPPGHHGPGRERASVVLAGWALPRARPRPGWGGVGVAQPGGRGGQPGGAPVAATGARSQPRRDAPAPGLVVGLAAGADCL